ncbi:MAG TPA: exodeoxyribonuclease III [Flavobacteriales bacterium]|nr:exodeoxyribonuclease III [Flavobacteriales bacterium]
MRIVTYNVNGLRSALSKGLVEWIQATQPDLLCLQEIKSQADQLDLDLFRQLGYEPYLFPAQKKGYSGVAILSKHQPDRIIEGMGMEAYDFEGRTIRLDFGDWTIINTYFPSGSSGEERQAFKMQFLADYQDFINELKKERPQLIICGDYNICHRAIDIHNPVSNAKSSGFLPEERAWMESFLNSGFVDSFRHLNKDPHHYTWWSYRAGARGKNLGWRIDYACITGNLQDKLQRAVILPEAKHSDHCPVLIEIDL